MKKRLLAILLTVAMTVQTMSVSVLANQMEDNSIVTTSPSDATLYDEEMDPAGSTFQDGTYTYRVTDWESCELLNLGIVEGDISIPDSVTDPFGSVYKVTGVAPNAFEGAGAAKVLTLPSGLDYINTDGAMLSDIEEIRFSGSVENTKFKIVDGVLYEFDGKSVKLLLYPSGSEALNFVIPNGTTEIASRAFFGVHNLRAVVIPDSVDIINKEAFAAFANSVEVAFNMDTAPTTVADDAFVLTDAADNSFYFKNEDVMNDILANSPDFTGETDVDLYSDGIPAGMLIIAENEGSAVNSTAGEICKPSEGWYYIQNGLSTTEASYVLDIEKGLGSTTKDANADIMKVVDGKYLESQLFYVQEATENAYNFIPYGISNFALDAESGASVAGTNIRQHKNNGTEAQQFYFVGTEDDGFFEIQIVKSAACLAAVGDEPNGANVELADWTNEASQKWSLLPAMIENEDAAIEDGWYEITTKMDPTLALDITLGIPTSVKDANLDIYTYDKAVTNEAQLFYVKKVDAANALYEFTPWTTPNFRLDCASGNYTEGTNVRQHKTNSTIAQRFKIIRLPDGSCKIQNASASTCFTVESASASAGNNVGLAIWRDLDSQKWNFVSSHRNLKNTNLAAGVYVLHTALNTKDANDTSRRVLGTSTSTMMRRTNVELMKDDGSDRTKFYIYPIGNSKYYIYNLSSQLALDVADGKAANRSNVQIYKKNSTIAQTWTIKQDTDGYYKIYSGLTLDTGKALCIDVNHGIEDDAQNIQIYKENYESKAQLWVFEPSTMAPLTNGIYEIATGLKADRSIVFDLPNRSAAEGVQYQVYTRKDISSQKVTVKLSGENQMTLMNIKTNKYLVPSGNALVQSSTPYTWKAVPTPNNTFYLETQDGRYAAPSNGETANLTPIVLTTSKDSASEWYLTKSYIGNGWQNIGGVYYYYSNFKRLTNDYVGNVYLDGKGVPWTGWHEAAKDNAGTITKGYYYYFRGRDGAAMDARPYIWQSSNWGKRSRTVRTNTQNGSGYTTTTRTGVDGNYCLRVDTVKCFIEVFLQWPGRSDYTVPVFAFKISPGLAPNVTNPGDTQIHAQSNWTELMGPSYGQYTSLLNYTDGEYIHSLACNQQNTYNVDPGSYNLLGQRASHGCMRSAVRNAFWIYMYCSVGTRAEIREGGHRLAIDLIPQPKMYGGSRIDPTDVIYTGNFDYVDAYNYYGSYYF